MEGSSTENSTEHVDFLQNAFYFISQAVGGLNNCCEMENLRIFLRTAHVRVKHYINTDSPEELQILPSLVNFFIFHIFKTDDSVALAT